MPHEHRGRDRDLEIVVDERRLRREGSRDMHELALILGRDATGLHVDDLPRALAQRSSGRDGAPLVPEQAEARPRDQKQPDEEPDDRIPELLQEADVRGLGEGIANRVRDRVRYGVGDGVRNDVADGHACVSLPKSEAVRSVSESSPRRCSPGNNCLPRDILPKCEGWLLQPPSVGLR